MPDHSQDIQKAAKNTARGAGYAVQIFGSAAALALGPVGLIFAAAAIAGGQSMVTLVDDSPDTGMKSEP